VSASDLIKVRQLASSVVHLADPDGLTQHAAAVFGSPCTAVVPPVATLCRATLRRDVIRIPDLAEAGYRVTCTTCLLLAEHSLPSGLFRGAL
jgi:hypothetical protein